ncbi:hypothetical protein HOLleu_34469 [Holothuria leucospilota]|uniref:Uncharacterized protein n=1 Tax=Holothuria leucospilota TaxID=206669 RepID=A0A9Q0YN92_HOLLE|nr:hypothetical protein HOLleu_34469 [Holothuria leucospilota]
MGSSRRLEQHEMRLCDIQRFVCLKPVTHTRNLSVYYGNIKEITQECQQPLKTGGITLTRLTSSTKS